MGDEGLVEVDRKNSLNKSDVYFNKSITDEVLKAYIASKEPFGKAGGYGIQGLASTLVERIDGDFYSVWGFPLVDFCHSVNDLLGLI